MKKILLFMMIVMIGVLLLGCASQKKVKMQEISANAEEDEITGTLNDLQDLDTISQGEDNVSFDELENLSLE